MGRLLVDVTVFLDDELARFVEAQISAGRFGSSCDLMREALRRMEAGERQDPVRLEELRAAWRDGIDSGDVGEIDFAALKAEARGRRSAPGS